MVPYMKAKKPRGIYKRGNIYWIMYADKYGVMHYESTKSTNRNDAEILLLQRRTTIKEGKEINKPVKHTFQELIAEYTIWAERQRGFIRKQRIMKQLSLKFHNQDLSKFNTHQLEQFQTERLNKGNKPATVNRLMATFSHMFTKANDWGWIEDSVLRNVRKAKKLPENNKRLKYLSPEEINTLLNFCDKNLRPIVATAINTGMRKSNILNLTWEQIDLRNGFILLDMTKNGERHEVPINDTLRSTLQSVPRRFGIPYVFINPETDKHTRISRRALKQPVIAQDCMISDSMTSDMHTPHFWL